MKQAYIQQLLLALFLTVAMAFHIYFIVIFGFSTLRVVLVAVTIICMAACAVMYGYVRKEKSN